MPVDLNAVHLALRLRAKPALPTIRESENVAFTPPATDPYSEEDFVPATATLRTMPAQGGTVVMTGLYVLRWFGVSGDGTAAMNAGLTALLAKFAPGLAITAGDGTVVRVREDVAPTRGQIMNLDNGRPVATVTIPWWLQTTNSL
jgi:hypothetical protein